MENTNSEKQSTLDIRKQRKKTQCRKEKKDEQHRTSQTRGWTFRR